MFWFHFILSQLYSLQCLTETAFLHTICNETKLGAFLSVCQALVVLLSIDLHVQPLINSFSMIFRIFQELSVFYCTWLTLITEYHIHTLPHYLVMEGDGNHN